MTRERGALGNHAPVFVRHAWIAPLVFFSIFLLYPLLVLIRTAISADTLTALVNSGPWSIALLSTGQSLASVGLSLIIGIPIAGVLARYQFKGRALVLALMTVPFVLPTVVVALAFKSILGELLAPGLILVILAHAYINVAVVVRIVGAQWSALDPRHINVAQTLGANPFRVFRTLTLPNLKASILSSACIVFVFSFTSLGVVVILGDGSSTRTLEQSILRQTSVLLDFPGALASALIQLVIVTGALILAAKMRGATITLTHTHRTKVRGMRRSAWVYSIVILSALIVLTPLAGLVIGSFTSTQGMNFSSWVGVINAQDRFAGLGSPRAAVALTISLALITALIASAIGGLAAIAVMGRRTFIAAIALIPLGLSAATIGLGTLLAFGRPPIDLRSSGFLIPIAHALVAIPLVVAVASPALRTADSRRFFVASSLGASPARAWWTAYGTLLRTVMIAAGGLAGAVSLGEFGAASFLARADSPTVPVQIAKLLARPGDQAYTTAAVLSTILVVMTLALMLFIDRFSAQGRITVS
jgi:thiamine transport system permease protein